MTVEAGQRFNRYVEVISDEVVEGGEVVTQGQARLIDGVELQIIDGDYQEKIEADTLISDAKEAEVKTEKK